MISISPDIHVFLREQAVPFRIWAGPAAAAEIGSALRVHFPQRVTLLTDPSKQAATLEGPAILLLVPDDLSGPHREHLLEIRRKALPGRPILLGGIGHRDALLDAINSWRVIRVLPTPVNHQLVLDAIQKAYDALQTEVSLDKTLTILRGETSTLEQAMLDLRTTQEHLLHAERLATIGRITRGLILFIREHQRPLEAFEHAVRPLTLDPRLHRLAHIAFEGTRTVASLLDEICAYAEERELRYEFACESLDELVERAVSLCLFDPLGRDRTVTMDFSSRVEVWADRHRLYQVVINLLRNAFQATGPEDQVAVRTGREGAWTFLEVIDSGTGIPDEVRARIFEPFFSTRGEHGMGLGLRISQLVIERHGGSIECHSTPGKGTTFRVNLPAFETSR